MDILRGIIGLCFLLAIAYLFSKDRKNVSWPLVVKGVILQFAIIAILQIPGVDSFFQWIANKFVKVISYTDDGSKFLFSNLENNVYYPAVQNFAFKILPTIVFFSALSALLYYIGLLQLVVKFFAYIMKWTLKISGVESLAAAGNIFLGQTETPLLIKPYLNKMTKAEIMSLMTGGMATIAGGVLAAFIGILGGDSIEEKEFFASQLMIASLMSAPAAIILAKILVPEREKISEDMSFSKDKQGVNVLEAITKGTGDGLRLAVNVGVMLLVFTAFMFFGNGILNWIGGWTHLNEVIADNTIYDGLSFQFILGYIGAPVVWLIGVCQEDALMVGQLLGEKTVLNEFFAYVTLGDMKADGVFQERKSVVMATYILCGFANFASIGIQIGGIGSLIPNRKSTLAKLGVRALIGGTLACLMTATIMGMLFKYIN